MSDTSSNTVSHPLAKRCEKMWGRAPTQEELSLLQRVRDGLELREDDSLWDILIALQTQKFYYDALPEKIRQTVANMLAEIEKSAEIEAQKSQEKLAQCVVEQAQKMAGTSSVSVLLFNAAAILFCAILACSISMWTGYAIGRGEAVSPEWLLQVPAGFVLAAVSLGTGTFFLFKAASDAASKTKGFKQKAFFGLGAVVIGALILSRTW